MSAKGYLSGFDFLAVLWIGLGIVLIFGIGGQVGIERSKTERARYENGCLPDPSAESVK